MSLMQRIEAFEARLARIEEFLFGEDASGPALPPSRCETTRAPAASPVGGISYCICVRHSSGFEKYYAGDFGDDDNKSWTKDINAAVRFTESQEAERQVSLLRRAVRTYPAGYARPAVRSANGEKN